MNPEILKSIGFASKALGNESLYGFNFADDEWNELFNGKSIEQVLSEEIEKSKEAEAQSSTHAEVHESAEEKSIAIPFSPFTKQEHAWKLRDRRYRAWVVQEGQGKMVESDQFNFLSEFFSHMEEEYDYYDLMDGFCIDEQKDQWVYEGDIVNVVGGEFYQGYHECDVTGIVECRGGSFCLVDMKNITYTMGELFGLGEQVTVHGHVYNQELLRHFQIVK